MKINKLLLYTSKIESTKQFYEQSLAMQVTSAGDEEIIISAGSTQLVFKHIEAQKPVYHFAFNIPDNKIEEALEWCHQQNLQTIYFEDTEVVDFPNWNAESLYFWDNNGNILEFIARRDLNNSVSRPFGPEQILCVSEIGIVTQDVPVFCNDLITHFGVNYYEKQPPAPNFSVIGDANGLLIAVPPNRPWFPTKITSVLYPIEITFTDAGTTHQLKFN
ncbi:MAG TPA: hypothetical protein VK154_16980 [Chitinophagales bacterium]|nr:hypothetical protein [Chitinophagales bacterium]